MGNLARTGYNPDETAISPSTAGSLTQAWSTHVEATGDPAASAIFSQPIVAPKLGLVFWGSFNGFQYASDLATGAEVWKANLGQTIDTGCFPPNVGVVSTAAFVDSLDIGAYSGPVLFVGGGDANVYAVAAATTGSTSGGTVLWKYNAGKPPATFMWSSPAFYNGSVYIGVASFCDHPLVRGGLLQLDAATGALRHFSPMVPEGCVGGSIWSSPAVDELGIGNDGKPTIYVSTGNHGPCEDDDQPLTEAIVELDAADITKILGHWRVLPSERRVDTDFGATPTIQDFMVNGKDYHRVGMLSKNGLFYEFERGDVDDGVAWKTQVSTSHNISSSAAFDGRTLFVSGEEAFIDGHRCDATVNSIDPLDGSISWRTCIDGRPGGGMMAWPGMVSIGGGHKVHLLNSADGSALLTYTDPDAIIWGLNTVANGTLYQGDVGGNLFALKLP